MVVMVVCWLVVISGQWSPPVGSRAEIVILSLFQSHCSKLACMYVCLSVCRPGDTLDNVWFFGSFSVCTAAAAAAAAAAAILFASCPCRPVS
ncbi:3-O-methyltransferase [Trichinella pseudospiralis]